MGYYTRYTLSIENCDDVEERILELRTLNENANYALTETGNSANECKWYEHDDDLLWFSSQYPEEIYTLEGEGEEQPDLWKKYYKNGKMQKAVATIVYDSYDEAKLV